MQRVAGGWASPAAAGQSSLLGGLASLSSTRRSWGGPSRNVRHSSLGPAAACAQDACNRGEKPGVKRVPKDSHYGYTLYADPAIAQEFDESRFGGPIGRLIAASQERVLAEFLGDL